MSLRILEQAIKAWSEGREPTLGELADATAMLAKLRAAANGLAQLDPRLDWDQLSWDDGLDLMEAIAKEAE